jgi:hypothetical protein
MRGRLKRIGIGKNKRRTNKMAIEEGGRNKEEQNRRGRGARTYDIRDEQKVKREKN